MITTTALISIFVSAVVGFAVGALWYSPILFGKKWMRLKQVNKDSFEDDMKTAMFKGFVIQLVMSYALYIFVIAFGVSSFFSGVAIGLYASLGLVGMNMLMDYVYEPNKTNSSQQLLIITLTHRIVALSLMAGVIGLIV